MKYIFGTIGLLFFCSLVSFVLWSVLGCNTSSSNTYQLAEYTNKLSRDKLKVIQDFDKLDNASKITEIDNVGKYYSDIVVQSAKAQCRIATISNIYDGKVIIENGKYIYQFKYDLTYPFGTSESVQQVDNSDKGAKFQDFFFFKRVTGKSMYLQIIPTNGYWELGGTGKYWEL